MKKITRTVMGMTGVVCIIDENALDQDISEVFSYFEKIDNQFSPFKKASEVSLINREELKPTRYSSEMKKILKLSEKTQTETNGYFNIYRNGKLDPSGIVKGYAIHEAAKKLLKKGYKNFYVEIGGDIEVKGTNEKGNPWKVGIKNPFNSQEIVKALCLTNCGVATSGNYKQGAHIYNPKDGTLAREIASITVIGKTVFDADRMATAAFAMGEKGIEFIEEHTHCEAYMITLGKMGVYTSGFSKYTIN